MLGFNDMSTLVGHFVSLPDKGRKAIEETVQEMKERDKKDRGAGMEVKKQKKQKHLPLYAYLLLG